MSTKTYCDKCGHLIARGEGATLAAGKVGTGDCEIEADLCDPCYELLKTFLPPKREKGSPGA